MNSTQRQNEISSVTELTDDLFTWRNKILHILQTCPLYTSKMLNTSSSEDDEYVGSSGNFGDDDQNVAWLHYEDRK